MGVGWVAIAGGATATAISLSSVKQSEAAKPSGPTISSGSVGPSGPSQPQDLNGDSESLADPNSHQPTTLSDSRENLDSQEDESLPKEK